MTIPERWTTRIVMLAIPVVGVAMIILGGLDQKDSPKATDIWKGVPSPAATQVAGMDITVPKGWQVIWEDSRLDAPKGAIIAEPDTCDVTANMAVQVDFCTQYVRITRISAEEEGILSAFDPVVDQCRPVTRFERKPDVTISGATFAYFEARCASGPGGKPLLAQAWSAPKSGIYITGLNAGIQAKQMFAGSRF